ncbi:MAG: hypothetical protein U0556_07270 [Dehalococcoidia bacterium]
MPDGGDSEETREQVVAAVRELETITTIDELRDWWRRWYVTLGHKRLARLAMLGWSIERLLNKTGKEE